MVPRNSGQTAVPFSSTWGENVIPVSSSSSYQGNFTQQIPHSSIRHPSYTIQQDAPQNHYPPQQMNDYYSIPVMPPNGGNQVSATPAYSFQVDNPPQYAPQHQSRPRFPNKNGQNHYPQRMRSNPPFHPNSMNQHPSKKNPYAYVSGAFCSSIDTMNFTFQAHPPSSNAPNPSQPNPYAQQPNPFSENAWQIPVQAPHTTVKQQPVANRPEAKPATSTSEAGQVSLYCHSLIYFLTDCGGFFGGFKTLI